MSKKTTIVKLESFSKLPIAKGSINGEDAYFIIDSGATITMFNDNDCNFYEFETEEDENGSAVGYGGNANFQQVTDLVLRVGGIELWAQDFKAQDISHIVKAVTQAGGPKINGVLGMNILKPHEFIINFSENSISFTH